MRVVLLLLASLVVGTALPFVREPYWWVREPYWWVRVFDFPRLQIAVLGLVVLGLYLWHVRRERGYYRRKYDAVVLALLVAALGVQAWRIAPYTPVYPVQSVRADAPEPGRSFRLVVSNVLMENRYGQRWLREIRAAEPDLVVMLEPDAWWIEQAHPLRRELPHALEHPLDNTYGIALYSRFPLLDVEVREVVEDSIPSIVGAFRLPACDVVHFAFVHPRPPRPGSDTDERDAELVLVARSVENHDGPLHVAGDLNDVAWSYTTTLFQETSGLLDPRVGRGFYSTYHAAYPFLRWPLDYVFHSEHLALVEMRRLGRAQSDHFPILAELALAPEAPAAQDAPDAEPADREAAREILDEARD